MISCSDSTDPECIAKAQDLKVQAQNLKQAVEPGNLLPVEALAQLANYAVTSFRDFDGFMWGMTNVLLGVDPNATEVWKLGMASRYGINN